MLQRTPTSDQQNNNHKIMFNARLYLRMTLNSPEKAMNSLVKAVFLQRTPTSDQQNNNHKIILIKVIFENDFE